MTYLLSKGKIMAIKYAEIRNQFVKYDILVEQRQDIGNQVSRIINVFGFTQTNKKNVNPPKYGEQRGKRYSYSQALRVIFFQDALNGHPKSHAFAAGWSRV
jgi:hypothetical protein